MIFEAGAECTFKQILKFGKTKAECFLQSAHIYMKYYKLDNKKWFLFTNLQNESIIITSPLGIYHLLRPKSVTARNIVPRHHIPSGQIFFTSF